MHIRVLRFSLFGILTILGAGACMPKGTPAVDTVGTAVAQAAFGLLTRTAAAASPTPLPPTVTPTSLPTGTPTVTPPPQQPRLIQFTGCWVGPGPDYKLVSNISLGKDVDLLGIGSVPGWYIIRNPYFNSPCWVPASAIQIFPGTDISKLPVMTPER